jgi:glycosyltransferase involved in cell wall biosynthesis
LANQPLISIVFSFRNEEGNIPELVRRVTTVFNELDGYGLEMLFVNDSSTDASLELLGGLRREDSRIRIINMSKRFGTAPCVLAGLEHAQGDAVVYMVTQLFLGGTILFTIGIQGIYIGKLYGESKGRPRYVIDSTIGLGNDAEPRR